MLATPRSTTRDVQLCATAAEEEEGVSRKTTAEKDTRAAPPEQDS